MSALLSRYIYAGGSTLAAKIVAMIGTFVEVYVLTTLIGKDGFGAFFYGFTIIMVCGIVIGGPMRSLILYRLSSTDDILTHPFLRSVFGLTILMGGITSLAMIMIGWTPWIVTLAVLATLEMTRVTLSSALQAMQNIPTMTFYNTLLPYGLRIVMLGILMVSGVSSLTDIAIGYCVAFAIPVIAMMVRYRIYPSFDFSVLKRDDYAYGLKTILTQLVHQNARAMDVIVIGSLGLMAATADYGLALKCATVLLIGKQMIAGLITPRIASGAIEPEFSTARFFEMSVAFMGIVGFACVGHWLIPLFGNYEGVEVLFFLVAASMIPKVMTGCAAEYLYMKGHAGWVLATSIITLIVTIASALILVPLYGATGSAFTVLIGSSIASAILTYAAWHTDHFRVSSQKDTITGLAMMVVCIATGLGAIEVHYGGMVMAVVTLCYLVWHRNHIQSAMRLARIG